MTVGTAKEDGSAPGDLADELSRRAPADGATVGLWPGMTIYRYSEPTRPTWDEIRSLSVCIVAQGRKMVTAEGQRYLYDRYGYLVLRSNLHFQSQILDASPNEPFLAFVLQIDPAVVRKVSAEMLERRGESVPLPPPAETGDKGVVTELDDELMSAVLRFVRSLSADTDRRVLAPLYLQEMVYRILQRDNFARLLHIAGQQAAGNPVAAALTHIAAHLAEPLTVTQLAERVSLSPSAFSRRFREVTGRSPYQFVKETRLERARELLLEGRHGVTDVSLAVGYSSASHFIKEFRARFGTTPREYASSSGLGGGLHETSTRRDRRVLGSTS